MKAVFLSCFLLLRLYSSAQSPYLSVLLEMDPARTDGNRYKIEMKICEPLKMTAAGDWFSKDTSAIEFASLKSADINCAAWFDKGMLELLSGQKEDTPFNGFRFGNQVFAFEKILMFKITGWSPGNRQPDMYVVLPVKYKSFRTKIDILGIGFLPGKVVFISEPDISYDDHKLNISAFLEDAKGTDLKDFSFREALEAH